MNVMERLSTKVGPLPVWAWGGIGAAVVWFLVGRGGTKAGDSSLGTVFDTSGGGGAGATTATTGAVGSGGGPPDPVQPDLTPTTSPTTSLAPTTQPQPLSSPASFEGPVQYTPNRPPAPPQTEYIEIPTNSFEGAVQTDPSHPGTTTTTTQTYVGTDVNSQMFGPSPSEITLFDPTVHSQV